MQGNFQPTERYFQVSIFFNIFFLHRIPGIVVSNPVIYHFFDFWLQFFSEDTGRKLKGFSEKEL